jgi:pilus assembly protein CpaE
VVDTASQFAPASLAALDATDTLLLVGAPDVPTVKSLRIALETLELLGLGGLDIRVVLNRAGADVGLEGAEIERVLRRVIAFEVPSDIAVPISLNHGSPVVLDAPDSAAGAALRSMASALVTPSGDGSIPQ